MRARADLLISAKQYPRHCFANISVDHHEFGRWHYRNELRRQDASSLLPVVDPDVVSESLGARVRHEIRRAARKFLGKVVRHCFPASMVVVAKTARHNATTMCDACASELASQPRENLALAVSQSGTNATEARA